MEHIFKILLMTSLTTIVTISNYGSDADPVNCPKDLEADLAEALKTCADEMRGNRESRSLVEGLKKQNFENCKRSARGLLELTSHAINLTLLKREIHDETSRFRRELLKLSINLLKAAPSDQRFIENQSDESIREKREEKNKSKDDFIKEIGELLVCAVERLIKEQPVLQKSIEECAKTHNKNDDKSENMFEKCVEDRVKKMCPNLKLN